MAAQLYMLDTNIVRAVLRRPTLLLESRFRTPRSTEVCISAVTEAELHFGVARQPRAILLARVVGAFLGEIEVRSFGREAAARYGALRAQLERIGQSLSALDTLIAAHALAEDAVLVTADKAFGRVPGLAIEDWLSA